MSVIFQEEKLLLQNYSINKFRRLSLSHDSPRKNQLKLRIFSLQQKNRKLKQQLKNALTKSNKDLKYYY